METPPRSPIERPTPDAQVYIVLVDGQVEGSTRALVENTSVHWASERSAPVRAAGDQVAALLTLPVLPTETLPPPDTGKGRPCVLETRDAQRIVGWLKRISTERIVIQHPALGAFSVQMRDVTLLRFGDLVAPIDTGEGPAVVLANGDRLEGPFTIESGSVSVLASIGDLQVPFDRVAALVPPTRAIDTAPERVVLADGSHIRVASIAGLFGIAGTVTIEQGDGARHTLANQAIVAWINAGVRLRPIPHRVVHANMHHIVVAPDQASSGVAIGRLTAPDSPWTDARATLWHGRVPVWTHHLTTGAAEAAFAAPFDTKGLRLHITPGKTGPVHALAHVQGVILTWKISGATDSIADETPR